MSSDTSALPRQSRLLPRADAPETADTRPENPVAHVPGPRWTIVDIDRYEVQSISGTLGYIDVTGSVFVVLSGHRYDRAVEIAQTLVFDDALRLLDDGAGFPTH